MRQVLFLFYLLHSTVLIILMNKYNSLAY